MSPLLPDAFVPLQGDFLELAIIFFVLALVAALLGAREVAGITMEIARWFVVIFLVLAVLTFLL